MALVEGKLNKIFLHFLPHFAIFDDFSKWSALNFSTADNQNTGYKYPFYHYSQPSYYDGGPKIINDPLTSLFNAYRRPFRMIKYPKILIVIVNQPKLHLILNINTLNSRMLMMI